MMQTTLPAVQANCSRVSRYACIGSIKPYKRTANRKYRRKLASIIRRLTAKPWLWFNETFSAPSLSSWDLW